MRALSEYNALPLIMVSAFIHPLWNMLLKQSRDKIIFYFNIHLFFTVLCSFILLRYPLSGITAGGWMLVLLSSIAHFFYQVYLCRSYELGELSLTYPIVRSAPLFVALMSFVFLRERLTAVGIIGIILTVLGAQLINQEKFSIMLSEIFKYKHKEAFIAAVLTAFFSALYSVIDKKGALAIHPVLFFYLFFALSGLFFGVYLLFLKQKRKNYWLQTKEDAFKITLASLMEFSSYILILYALRISKVAVVVAIRQISVVFGAMLGILILKEQYGRVRVIASLIIFIGIYLLVAFG